MNEVLYQCPRCKSGPRPKGEWASRYGVMTCGVCLQSGYVILPEIAPHVPELSSGNVRHPDPRRDREPSGSS